MWEMQSDPYTGDVINSYNDGPPAPGAAPLGPSTSSKLRLPRSAWHLESSIPTCTARSTWPVPKPTSTRIARATLGVGLTDLTGAFPPK